MVVGEEGVRRVRRIVDLDNASRENNSRLRAAGAKLDGIHASCCAGRDDSEAFVELEVISNIDAKIAEKEAEIGRASRASELKRATEPSVFPSQPKRKESERACTAQSRVSPRRLPPPFAITSRSTRRRPVVP